MTQEALLAPQSCMRQTLRAKFAKIGAFLLLGVGPAAVLPPAWATSIVTLYSFPLAPVASNGFGENPFNGLILGSNGNLYGTTDGATIHPAGLSGGSDYGTIFGITPTGVFTTLYQGQPADNTPLGSSSSLMQASDGNLYGVQDASQGTSAPYCCGSVFKITPSGTFTDLVNLTQTNESPESALVQGSDGNLYGTTTTQFFRVTTAGQITFLYTVPTSPFTQFTTAALAQDNAGDFYGMELESGDYNGSVFKITPSGTYSAIYSFTGAVGSVPGTYLIVGSDGNLYGTTTLDCYLNGEGAGGYGTIFKLTPAGTLTTLYSFSGEDGCSPSDLVQGSDGNFYGTTAQGGAYGYGTVFKLTSTGILTTLYTFTGTGDGAYPHGNIVLANNLTTIYGTANSGGAYNFGTVYQLSLDSNAASTADLSITGGGSETPPQGTSGAQTGFTLTVTNAGPATAQNVVVTATIPNNDGVPDGTLISSASSAGCTISGATLACVVGNLGVGASSQLTIVFSGAIPATTFRVGSNTVDSSVGDDNTTITPVLETVSADAPIPQWALIVLGLALLALATRQRYRRGCA